MKKTCTAITCVLLTAMVAAPAIRSAEHAVILQYHHFSADTPRITSVTVDELRGHLDHLEAGGFTVLPLVEIVDSLRAGGALPDRTVAITIDDAYANLTGGAAELLAGRGVPATVFVPTEPIDRGFRDYLDWDQMRALQAQDFSFASHGHRHLHMARPAEGETPAAWRERMHDDILHSLERLRDELGADAVPPLFAYPYGEYSVPLAELVAELGLTGFAQMSGPVWPGADLRALPRFPASGPYAELKTLRDKLLSLPLPLTVIDPLDPVIEDPRPTLRLQLAPGDYRLRDLAAYVSGQGRTPIVWIDREALVFEVTAASPLPEGRSRYNLTLPDRSGRRYMWYSHPWLFGDSASGDDYE